MARCRVDTLEQQVERALQQYNDRETDIRKNSFLQSMKCGSYHSHRPTAIGSLTRTRLTSMRSFSDISLTSLHYFIDLVVFRYETPLDFSNNALADTFIPSCPSQPKTGPSSTHFSPRTSRPCFQSFTHLPKQMPSASTRTCSGGARGCTSPRRIWTRWRWISWMRVRGGNWTS